jgi:predicted membrane-bound spermidine synthase
LATLTLYKRLLSYITPVLLRKTSSDKNPLLELHYYRGRLQLATADALYSDGEHYRPMRIGFKQIRGFLPEVKQVLVLGTGLGSAVQVMDKMGYHPNFTMVDHDNTVLKWAMEALPGYGVQITPVCADAQQYMIENHRQFDLLIVDIFNGRIVPGFVMTPEFMNLCRNSIRPGGKMVMNYIVQRHEDWSPVDSTIRKVFPQCHCIDDGLNRVVVATV